jgi:hypothetical protein
MEYNEQTEYEGSSESSIDFIDFEPLQLDWLVNSPSLLNKIASILEDDSDIIFKSTAGRRMSKRVQERERDRIVGLVRRAAENGLLLISEV